MNLADDKPTGADVAAERASLRSAPEATVNVRLTYADEALGQPAVDADLGPLPVALLELTRWQQVIDSSNTSMRALYVEDAVAAGLPRWKGVQIYRLYRHPGWSVGAREGRVELHGPRGVWARGVAEVHPSWQVAASRFGDCVLALIGPVLGVQVPPGTWEAQFTREKRRSDLLAAATARLVAGGLLECRFDAL